MGRADSSFADVLQTLVSLGAERVLVLEGPQPFKVRASVGIVAEQPWDEQVSMSLLESTLEQGAPLLLGDAQASPQAERWSLLINSVRSVLCVPFWSPSSRIAGLLYADTCSRAGVFSAKAMEAVQMCARKLEASLYGGPKGPALGPAALAPAGALGLRPAAKPAAAPVAPAVPVRAPLKATGRVRGASVTIFLRSLATMTSAGVPLVRGLDMLALHEQDPALRAVLQEVTARVQSGTPLSVALGAHPRAIPSLYVQMIRVGERTGAMHTVLARLAEHRERAQELEMRLRQALTYPACVLVMCLGLLIFGLPYMLAGQFEMFRNSGQAVPLLTQGVMKLSDLARNPFFLLALGGTAAALAWGVDWARLAERVPGLKRVMLNVHASRFAATLALASRVGLPLQESLKLAAQGRFEAEAPAMVAALEDGATLAQSLRQCPALPELFLQMVAAGEESGKVSEFLAWTAGFYELELSSSLERFLALLEPLLLLGIGILVGLVLLATLLPMVSMLGRM